MSYLSPLQKSSTRQLVSAAAADKRPREKAGTHEIRLSMDVSIGLVFRDFKNDANPGVNGADEGGMILCAYNHICPAVHQLAGL